MGNVQKSYQPYKEYLQEDPLWGWGWIGYYRQLHDFGDEYSALGNQERANYFYKLENVEQSSRKSFFAER